MREIKPQQENSHNSSRQFLSNRPNQEFVTNQIKTTTTNVLTFVPINLLNQMKNMANIYFIIIAILQMIPSISVTGGTPTILFPLAAVMLAVMVKDAVEEYYRYTKDKKENEREVEVLVDNRFAIKTWETLRVGDVIKIRKNDLIPCDSVVVKTSDPENKCFVETKGLDGETNLKLKTSFLNNIPNNISKDPDSYKYPYEFNVGAPAMQINKFDGTVVESKSKTKIPLDSYNLLLRGCSLRNVHEVIAICCYTGSDTKLVLNSAKFEPKKSKLMSEVDKIVIEIFIWQVIIALVCSLFNSILENSYKEVTKFIPMSNYWITTLTWWLLMTYFVPISLMVTMEMVKLFQGSILARDRRGYSKEYDCCTEANNTSVNQNLGQIKYVFTDKTGTLTKNNMVFRHLICNENCYGNISKVKQAEDIRRTVNFTDNKFQQDKNNPKIQDALKIISLCHEVTIDVEDGVKKYNSSSPDQVALVNFAKQAGREFMGEEKKMLKIAEVSSTAYKSSQPKIVEYQKLAVLEFNSDRKRMSVIIRDPNTRRIEVLTKGADSTMKTLLRDGQRDLPKTQQHIDRLSVEGLRTLLLGKKILTQDQYNRWNRDLQEARGIIGDQKKIRIAECYEKIEKNMDLVGATAIEDELQDEVKETIESMRLSGMNFFILTGDKKETAVTIGRSCGLIDKDMEIVNIPDYTPQKDREWRMNMLVLKEDKKEKVFLLNAQKTIPPEIPLQPTICYRCTPKNKEQIVRRVKENTSYLTMAVGDGANDVNMIKEASVGIGIRGKEGTQAARVADYVAGEFKFIKMLTLYYGREWYRKNCDLVNYSFYKNWFHVSSVIAFGGFSYFSGVVLFNVYLYELLNVIYSSWPIIIYALFDEEYTHSQSYKYYDLYEPGINNAHFNQSSFLKNLGTSILHGIIAMMVVFEVLEAEVLQSSGKTGYLQLSGSVLFGLIIIIINLKILTMSTGVKPLNTIVVLLSIAMYWISQAIYGKLTNPRQLVILKEEWSYSPVFFVQIILIFFLLMVEFGYSKYQRFKAKYHRYKQEEQNLEFQKDVFEGILKGRGL